MAHLDNPKLPKLHTYLDVPRVEVDNETLERVNNVLKVKDAGITTAKIADGAVTSAKLADSSVTSTKIASGAVTNAKLADGSVTSAKIADGAVTNAKIADGTIDLTTKCTYVPLNKAGDTMSGSLTIENSASSTTLKLYTATNSTAAMGTVLLLDNYDNENVVPIIKCVDENDYLSFQVSTLGTGDWQTRISFGNDTARLEALSTGTWLRNASNVYIDIDYNNNQTDAIFSVIHDGDTAKKLLTVNEAGDVSIAGNVSLPAGKTVDGVDISEHKHTGASGDAPKIPTDGLEDGAVTGVKVNSSQVRVNYAKFATLTVASDRNVSNVENVRDGDDSTSASIEINVAGEAIRFDLGSVCTIRKIWVKWKPNYSDVGLRVEVSADGSTWTTLLDRYGALDPVTDTWEGARNVRYVRISNYGGTASGAYSYVYEILISS